MFRENVIFGGARAWDGEICNISWKEVNDADSGTAFDILEWKREGSATWGGKSVSVQRKDGGYGPRRN